MSEITNRDREAARAFIGTATEKHLPYWHANETRLAQAFADHRTMQANAMKRDHVASADKMIPATELATLRRRVAELEGENRDATEALRRALRQWKSYYEPNIYYDDDDDYDLETAKHPEGDLYRWCAKQLAILEAKQPATEKHG